MKSQIIFLGTGGGRNTILSQERASGGIIIQAEDHQFHIDPGPGALVRAKEFGVNIKNNTFIITTHNHIDHCNDLNAIIEAMTFGGVDQAGVLVSDESVVNGSESEYPSLNKSQRTYLERVITIKPFEKVKLPKIEIKALPTKHRCQTTIGIKLITPKFTATYSSDTSYFPELIKEYEDSDVLILNCMRPASSKADDHLNSDDCAKIIEKVRPKLAIIQHFGKKMLKANPVYEAREIQRQTKIPTIAARDGMIIDPLSYSISSKQSKLLY